jgi:hypothetical protein
MLASLNIAYGATFALSVADAAKVLEILGNAKRIESTYVGGEDYRTVTYEIEPTNIEMRVLNGEIYSKEQVEQFKAEDKARKEQEQA